MKTKTALPAASAATARPAQSLAARMRIAYSTRHQAIELAERRLSYPRLQMTLIVALTGATGLLASFLLLHAGLFSMTVRYPIAVGVAYIVFLLLLWAWLRTSSRDWLDAVDMPMPMPSGSSGDVSVPSIPFSGGGGDFSGAGASASFDGDAGIGDAISRPISAVGDAVGSVADGLDLDDGAIPIIVIVVAVCFGFVLAIAAFYVIYIAPVLLAEVLVDGALSYGLYRRLRIQDSPLWLVSACRRTAVPFACAAILFWGAGIASSMYAPGARSVGEVLHYHAPEK